MNTPTPRADENAQWSNSCSFEEKLQMKVCELRFAKTLERELTAMTAQRDGLRAGIDYASDQLIKVKEQRDQWANLWADLSRASVKDTVKVEREVVRVTEQRDRLAEALNKIKGVGLVAVDAFDELDRIDEIVDAALQSLNKTTEQ